MGTWSILEAKVEVSSFAEELRLILSCTAEFHQLAESFDLRETLVLSPPVISSAPLILCFPLSSKLCGLCMSVCRQSFSSPSLVAPRTHQCFGISSSVDFHGLWPAAAVAADSPLYFFSPEDRSCPEFSSAAIQSCLCASVKQKLGVIAFAVPSFGEKHTRTAGTSNCSLSIKLLQASSSCLWRRSWQTQERRRARGWRLLSSWGRFCCANGPDELKNQRKERKKFFDPELFYACSRFPEDPQANVDIVVSLILPCRR